MVLMMLAVKCSKEVAKWNSTESCCQAKLVKLDDFSNFKVRHLHPKKNLGSLSSLQSSITFTFSILLRSQLVLF
jgi:hypothetical protein